MQAQDLKKFYIETLEVVVTGSGKAVLQDIIEAEDEIEFGADRSQTSTTAKRYNENLCRLQGLPLLVVSIAERGQKEA